MNVVPRIQLSVLGGRLFLLPPSGAPQSSISHGFLRMRPPVHFLPKLCATMPDYLMRGICANNNALLLHCPRVLPLFSHLLTREKGSLLKSCVTSGIKASVVRTRTKTASRLHMKRYSYTQYKVTVFKEYIYICIYYIGYGPDKKRRLSEPNMVRPIL